jgi:chromosome segregation ATPase
VARQFVLQHIPIVLQAYFKIPQSTAERRNKLQERLAEADSRATNYAALFQAERGKNLNHLAQISARAEKIAQLEAELGKQALHQQQLQEENCVLRAKNVSLRENSDDLRTRVNWVKERADKLAQQLSDEHGELTAALADIQQSVKRQRRSCKKN